MAQPLLVPWLENNLRYTIPGLLIAGVVIYMAFDVLHNIFLHPLRNHPGPLLWRISSLPWCYHQIKGDRTHLQAKMHWKYGDIVRLRPNELSYTGEQAWNDIFAHHPGREEFPKDPRRQDRNPNNHNSILGANKRDHARYRRLLAAAFSEKGLQEQQPLITKHVNFLIDRLDEFTRTGNPLDMTKWYNMIVFDMIGDLAWGEPFHCLRDQKLHDWIPAISETVKFTMQSSILYEYGLGLLVPFFVSKEVRQQRKKNFAYAEEKVNYRVQQGSTRGDFWDRIMIKSEDDNAAGDGMTKGEMLSNSSIIVLAGSETSATTLSGITYLLLRNPKALKSLVQEIRSSFKSSEEISMFSVSRLGYLLAVFQETLRLYPPVPTHSQRVPPKGGAVICGTFVPEKTSLGFSMMGAYGDPRNFHRPNEFLPERWLENAPPEFAQDNKGVFQPWSLGTRNCLGRNLAYAEIRLIVAKILWHFNLTLEEERMDGDWFDQKIWGVWFKNPLWIKLSPAQHDME